MTAGRLLAFECVARTASACVVEDGREVAYADLGGGEAEAGLITLLDRLLREHGPVQALAVAEGPGSFTGLRIAAVAARTLAWLEGVPVHAVDSLTALALERGDGLWAPLLPLKKDTTFAAVIRVSNGAAEILRPTTAILDATDPALPPEAVGIGPALTTKPDLAARWCRILGDPAPLTARGVARAARLTDPRPWSSVLPAYHQKPAPVLQREAALTQA
jgi:tRNA threonylcarbamoyl adenosine modification protein YeaZ